MHICVEEQEEGGGWEENTHGQIDRLTDRKNRQADGQTRKYTDLIFSSKHKQKGKDQHRNSKDRPGRNERKTGWKKKGIMTE